MKKTASILFLLITGLMFSQKVNRFYYELTFKPKKDSAKTEKVMTILDIWKDKSAYRDYTMVSQDSLMKKFMEKAMQIGNFFDMEKSGIKYGKFSYDITKPYPPKEIIYTDNILQSRFSYKEPININWKLDNDTQTITSYHTQKAECDFGGRHWIAWFTTDLPLNDGPYKFFGLPGLIVKIEDTGHNYSWELKGNESITEEQATPYMGKMMATFGVKPVMITKEKFEKAYANYKKDPFGSFVCS
ncbi:GLPGLI family protein [Riemerella columbipharyngis]|uniref:GLPGLI family protein n=1 Tax=Riemerella columbipharyngis TaxID=1071918 RepID=A0A1G7E8H3_9FLAO|nr:GLPGLI family protein [Riemerella columbipharyngis]SDE59909.1 GLPGLI family protein [Riemerella columbipharyngis]